MENSFNYRKHRSFDVKIIFLIYFRVLCEISTMAQELYTMFESLLQVTIGPLLHGVILWNGFSYYNLQYMFARTLAEIVIIFLKVLLPSAWAIIMSLPVI